jgi:hypothetical protein
VAAAKDPKKRKGSAAAEVDDATRMRIDTELRNALAGRDPEFASAVLARIVGVSASAERRPVDAWFGDAARTLADPTNLERRVEASNPAARLALALLTAHPWWTRTALVQALALMHGPGVGDDPDGIGKTVAKVLLEWPVLVRTNAFTRTEELGLFEPLAVRVRPLVEGLLAVGRGPGEPRPGVGLGRTLLMLALFPGLVAQRRPRVTRSRELHGADATKLERALGDARGLFATWERLGAFEEIDGALAPVAPRIKRLLDDPASLVRELVGRRLGEVGWALAKLAARAEPGDVLSLGSSLLAIGLSAGFPFGLEVQSLASRIERDDLRFAPFLFVDPATDALSIPPDVRAAIRGEPLAVGPAASGFVQPNYEVVMPPGVPLGAVFVVACASELVHFEAVARMKITRESVLAARGAGIEADEIVAALEAISAPRPLPPAVKHAVEEWGLSVGEARIRTAVLFDVRAAPALLEKIEGVLGATVLDRPAAHLFVLSRSPNPKELAALRALGVVSRAAAGAPSRGAEAAVDDEDPQTKPSWPLSAERGPVRDLKADLDPYRILALVDASRPAKKGSGPSSVRGAAFDPDEGAERPLPPTIDTALEERRVEWSARADWLRDLARLADSAAFRRAAATSAGPLALAIRRAGDPQRLQLEVARIVAESSVRRAAD